jgi:DedD protein
LNHPAASPPGPAPRNPTRNRLVAALGLIAVAIAALAGFDHFRQPQAIPPAPHEPSEALIAPPPPAPEAAPGPEAPAAPPPPPVVVNEADRAAPAVTRPPQSIPAESAAYLVQAGVFNSSANAQALQQRLAKAGVRAKVETRVQLGPYKDRREAEQAMAKLRKLGINAVLLPAR